jgi:hypothetical protein
MLLLYCLLGRCFSERFMLVSIGAAVQSKTAGRGRGGRGRGRGRGGRRQGGAPKSNDELDAEMDAYMNDQVRI